MLKGDLVSTPLPAVLRQLADGVASGCLHVSDGVGEEAKVFLRGGQVYAVQVPGRRPQLGARLVSSGSLGPEALAEALEAQRTELQGWRLGELLVHLGYVDQPVVEAFINEQVREQTSDLMRWPTGTWKFRVNERTREDVAPPTPVEELLAEIDRRKAQWETITEVLHGPDAIPMLSAAGQSDSEMAIDPEAWSLLCKVDGHRSVAELARECGFTLFEAGQVVFALVRSGLLEVEEVVMGSEAPTGSVASRLAAAFAPAEPVEAADEAAVEAPEPFIPAQAEEPSPAEMATLISNALREDRTMEALTPLDEDEVSGSLNRVSQALSALLGPTTDESLFDAPKPRKPKVKPPTPTELDRAAKKADRAALDAKRRQNDAAELAAAQAELEAARLADAVEAAAAFTADHEAEIVSLADVRRERDEDEAEALRLAEEATVQAEETARLEEQARLEAEAAAAEAARLAEEQAAADEQARLDEEARLAAEADAAAAEAAAAEAAAAEAAAAEAARLAEEQAAADEQARLDEEARLAAEADAAAAEAAAAEAAAAEAARLAEEQAAADEQARLDEEARLAAEADAAAEAEAEAEAARLAEEQARVDEEARLAAEAQRLAQEQAEAEAAEAAAAEAEAARLAEEQAAADERARLDEEARLAAEAEEQESQQRAHVEAELRQAAEEQEAAAQAAAAAAAEAEATAELERLLAAQAAADAEQDEQVHRTTQRADVSGAFAELSAAAASSSDVQVLEVEVATEAEAVEDDADDEPAYKAPDTDMASLFRELSSLGMEDAPEPPPTRPVGSTPRPATPAPPAKKKKGLFGR